MTNFLAQNWGNVASVVGLGISIWVLVVAQKAKQAAEEARSAARLKSLVEVLEEASAKAQQIGFFLRSGKWDVVHLLAEGILNVCKLIRSRWGESLPERAGLDLDEVATITKSIAGVADNASMRQLDERERRQAAGAQVELIGLLAGILGEARKAEEKR